MVTDRITIICREPVQSHIDLRDKVLPYIKAMTYAGHVLVVEVKPQTRTTEQNARLWAMLTDVSEQVNWYGRKLKPEEWKHVFTAALSKQDVVPNIDGSGFVVLGKATSKMTKREMCDLQTLIEAFGVDKGVKFTAPDWMQND